MAAQSPTVLSWVLCAWGTLSLALVLNALWPRKGRDFLLVLRFFLSWWVLEMPFHWLVAQVGLSYWLVLGGAAATWPGQLGLATSFGAVLGLIVILREAGRASRYARSAIGDDHDGPSAPLSRLALPFWMGRRATRVTRNVVYGKGGGRKLRLDVVSPRAPGQLRPAIIQLHGGGWVIGDKREQGLPLLHHLAAAGWVGFNVNYRLSPSATFPDHLIDVKRAIAWVREHASEWGVDPDFIAITGGSAGGHLTALAALTAGDPEYQPGFEQADTHVSVAVPFYGVYCFTDRLGLHHPSMRRVLLEPLVMKAYYLEEPERFQRASPLDRIHADAPPMLLVHGAADTLAPVEYARLFASKLNELAPGRATYLELKGAQHAFDVFHSPRTRHVLHAVERYLRRRHAEYRARKAPAA